MRAKASAHLDDLRKSIAVESDDDATRSSSGGGSSQNRHQQQQIDLSVLRKPILTAVTGFLEAHKAYEAGTEEIRKLLTSECDVLYECRVCRNLFRSLTNFISHKRVYCRKLFNVAQHFHFQNDGFLDQDLSTILQAEQDSQRKAKKVHADILNKDLSSIIERLRRKQHKISADLSLTDYYDRVNHKLTQDDLNRQQHLLQLDRVPNSSAAVYQTVRGLSTNGDSANNGKISDSMSAQVGELEAMTDRTKTVLGPDGKVVSRSQLPVICDRSNRYFQPIEEGEAKEKKQVASHTCSECNLQFDTDQTLKLHQEMKHTPSTYVYTCPSCSRTFLQPAAVFRHLSNDHKKSMRRIKMMRDSIFKRRTRVDEVVVKGPSSREMSRLQNSNSSSSKDTSSGSFPFSAGNGFANSSANGSMDDEAAATRAWMENLEHFDQGPMCSYCGKTFDRKAVLATHMQTCVQKIRQTENGAGSVPPSGSSGRRSKVKDEQLPPPPPPPPAAVKIKQEVVDAVISDDSNSYDVPLATLQARFSSSDNSGTVVTVKPEELAGEESRSRRKRQKPTIMLRNANDDISWEDPEEPVPAVAPTEVQIKQEPMEEEEFQTPTAVTKAKPRGPRNRKKKVDEPEVGDKELAERIEADGEIVCRCAKKYNDPERYKHHLRVFHSRQRRFWCAICEFKGYRKVDTVNHLMQEHGYKGDAEDIGSLINFQPPEEKCKKKPTPSQQTQPQPGPNSSSNQPAATSTSPPPPTPPAASPVQSIISSVIDAVTARQRDNLGDTSAADISLLLESTVESVTSDSTTDGSPRKRGRPRGFRDSICLAPGEELGKRVKSEVLEEPRSPTSKRPIRNRVKPVDKDFVYDLTHLLHKEEDLDDFPLPELVQEKVSVLLPPPPPPAPAAPTFGRSRSESSRNSCSSSANSTPEKREPPTTPSKKESLRSHAPKPKPSLDPALYRGAALAMAKTQVEAGRAAFHKPPNIPQERPFVPSRMSPPKQLQPPTNSPSIPKKAAAQQQTTLHDWPVVKKERRIGSIAKNASDLQIKRRYLKRAAAQLQLPQLIREQRKAIPRRNSVVPLTQRLSATVEILNKLNASRSAEGLEVVQVTDFPMAVRCPTAAEFKRYIEANLKDHRATMAQVNLNGTTVEDISVKSEKQEEEGERVKVKEETAATSPRKRITMMQRMEENRTKRMQEQNGSPPDIVPQLPAAASTLSSSSAKDTSFPAAANQIQTSSSATNVTDMLHAKLKRFSSL